MLFAQKTDALLFSASIDNIRLWNVSLEPESKSLVVPFQILPGHHGGVISQIRKRLLILMRRDSRNKDKAKLLLLLVIDITSRYMITTSGNRGWEGNSTNACLFYEINPMM